MLWLRVALNAAKKIKPERYLDSERRVQKGDIRFGVVNEEIKQLFTYIQRLKWRRNALLASSRSSRVNEKTKEKRKERANKMTSRLKVLNKVLSQQIKERIEASGGHFEIRKGFVAIWVETPSSEDS